MNKMIQVNVVTLDADGVKVPYLSVDNCPPQLLSSVISLCKAGMVVEVHFDEVELLDGMRQKVND